MIARRCARGSPEGLQATGVRNDQSSRANCWTMARAIFPERFRRYPQFFASWPRRDMPGLYRWNSSTRSSRTATHTRLPAGFARKPSR